MKTLCLDSAHKYLVIGLYENDRMICGTANLSWKRQSETIFPELMRLMKEAGWDSDDVDEVVITDGPGSYTGVRIAMCLSLIHISWTSTEAHDASFQEKFLVIIP